MTQLFEGLFKAIESSLALVLPSKKKSLPQFFFVIQSWLK